ncbi:MAG: PAS domain S-box protein [Melioribacteraceae bacterium]|nr:PAS domain S-box protein [Melioribacteraceae bacterium]
MLHRITPTDVENVMREDDFIVSKTDTKGIITYANRTFLEFAKYKEEELIGVNHNIIRHPLMPRVVFKLLWDTVQAGNEINAYVINLAKDGSFYWVLANITPVTNNKGELVGYYSVRRKPKRETIKIVEGLYAAMLQEEKKYEQQNKIKEGMVASGNILGNLLNEKGMQYDEFILAI